MAERETEIDMAAGGLLAFALFGGFAALLSFAALRFVFDLPAGTSLLAALALGLAVGLGVASFRGGRVLAIAILDIGWWLSWLS